MIEITTPDRKNPPFYDTTHRRVPVYDYNLLEKYSRSMLIQGRRAVPVKNNRKWRSKRLLKKLYKAIAIHEYQGYRIKSWEIIYRKVEG